MLLIMLHRPLKLKNNFFVFIFLRHTQSIKFYVNKEKHLNYVLNNINATNLTEQLLTKENNALY